MFRFKRFSVDDSHSSMKVGTDAVLLGAWCDVAQARAILDIGTGSGIVALMVAQRSRAVVVAIDIDEGSVADAKANALSSEWSERIAVELCELQEHRGTYDHIVSNPPFFSQSLTPESKSRRHARHTITLDFDTLCRSAQSLLSDNGKLSVIIPFDSLSSFVNSAHEAGLSLSRQLNIKPREDRPPKRVLMEFTREQHSVRVETLSIETDTRHHYCQEYIALTQDFYLDMQK